MKNMQLFIMRHGQASPIAANDSQRELTPNGFLETSEMAKWLNDSKICFDNILVSPFVRAQQTAKTLMADKSSNAKLTTLDFITPSGNAKQVHDYLDGLINDQTNENLLIVSHMPLVSYLVEELTVDNACPIFQTAAIAHIDYDIKAMTGQLVQLISPYDV